MAAARVVSAGAGPAYRSTWTTWPRRSRSCPAPPVLVGHSNGGLVVQKYLETHSAPAAVLLASVPSSGLLWPTLNSARQHPWQFLVANLTLSLYPLVSTPALARATFFSPSMPIEQVRAYHARMTDESFLAFLDGMLFNRPRPALVKTPLLVLGAANDRLIDSPRVRATARAYGTQAELFPNMNHGMMLEAGWEAVASRMLEWMNEKDEG
jgi:alpha-beta hydrolase superfamily lysophospholipase